jgi:hypothetical protein
MESVRFVFIELVTGLHFSGKVLEDNADFIKILDRKNEVVTLNKKSIAIIQERSR